MYICVCIYQHAILYTVSIPNVITFFNLKRRLGEGRERLRLILGNGEKWAKGHTTPERMQS